MSHGDDNYLMQDDEVQQMVLGPMKETQDDVLKRLARERKKMESRRLDFDYKVGAMFRCCMREVLYGRGVVQER